MSYPIVTIITVNYKQPGVTCELLDTIAQLKYPNLETIVVDNGQLYDDSFLFKYHLPGVKVINVKENVGFAGANNIGIHNSSGEYILLLNNDTEIEKGLIKGLLKVFKKDKNIGAVSPVLTYYDHPEKIQFAGFTKINPLTGRNRLIQKHRNSATTTTPYIHGAAVMIPKTVIDKCGLMPEEYFLYYEELEWSRQITKRGYELKVANHLQVRHKESVSTGKSSPLKVYYQNRNRIHFMRKSKLKINLFIPFYLLFSVPKSLFRFLIHKEKDKMKALIDAIKDGLIDPKYGAQQIT